MRAALTALGLLAAAFVAGSLAAAIGYGDEARCVSANALERTDDGTWQWWPWGYRCELLDHGSAAPEQQAATAGGTLLAVVGAFVALSLAWRFRARAWARGLASGVLCVALTGLATPYVGGVLAWAVGVHACFALGAVAYFRLQPERAREGARIWANVSVSGAAAVVVAVFFVFGGWTWVGLVVSLPVAAASGGIVERLARLLAARHPV